MAFKEGMKKASPVLLEPIKARSEARAQMKQDVQLDISGSDLDARMIEIAKNNAEEAGVADSSLDRKSVV